MGKIFRKVQVQLMIVFGIALLAYGIATSIAGVFFQRVITRTSIDYSQSISQIEEDAQGVASYINNPANNPMYTNIDGTQMSAPDVIRQLPYKAFLIDSAGKVLVSTSGVEQQVNVFKVIQAATTSMNAASDGSLVVRMYPVQYKHQADYLVVEGTPSPNVVNYQEDNPLSRLIGLAAFIGTFYLLTRRKIRYIQDLGKGLNTIATGDLSCRVEHTGFDELALLAENINHMADALERQIESERRAERTKNELITNVSHDLRTPLTIVMGYLRILKDRRFENADAAAQYIDVAYEKSEKLATLIEDLFEYTKLANEGLQVTRERVWLNQMLEQLVEEFVTLAEEANITIVRDIAREKLQVQVNPEQLTRVFENLLSNSIQHSDKPGVITISLAKVDDRAVMTVENQGTPISAEEIPRLFERFYRGDLSRTSSTGGSGLGLAIAKSIVETYQGSIHCECEGNLIRFVVQLPLASENHATDFERRPLPLASLSPANLS